MRLADANRCGYVWRLGHPDYSAHKCVRDKDHPGRHRCDCGKMKEPKVGQRG